MKIRAEPYKSPRKNVKGGRAWIIPTDGGEISANLVAAMIGITPAAIHSRLRNWLLGQYELHELLQPPQRKTAEQRKAERLRDCPAGRQVTDEFNRIPDEDAGKYAHLSERSRYRKLAKIKLGTWEVARWK